MAASPREEGGEMSQVLATQMAGLLRCPELGLADLVLH
jgi:hypothetical protein